MMMRKLIAVTDEEEESEFVRSRGGGGLRSKITLKPRQRRGQADTLYQRNINRDCAVLPFCVCFQVDSAKPWAVQSSDAWA